MDNEVKDRQSLILYMRDNDSEYKCLKYEWHRLSKFGTFEPEVSCIKLARSGFYPLSCDEVTCYFCKRKICFSEELDSSTLHNVTCSLINGHSCNNEPIRENMQIENSIIQSVYIGGPTTTETFKDKESESTGVKETTHPWPQSSEFGSVESRLCSFAGCRERESGDYEQLAKWGFINYEGSTTSETAKRNTGVTTTINPGPRNPEFRNVEARLRSFAGCKERKSGYYKQLAISGFFDYKGLTNSARCHWCGFDLRYSAEGDAFELHAKLYSECGFLQEQKSPEFIREQKEKMHRGRIQEEKRSQNSTTETKASNDDNNNGLINVQGQGDQTEVHQGKKTTETGAIPKEFNPRGFHVGKCEDKKQKLLYQTKVHQGKEATETGARPKGFNPRGCQYGKRESKKQKLLCKICKLANVNAVFQPCMHLVSCLECAKTAINCISCSSEVTGIKEIFLA